MEKEELPPKIIDRDFFEREWNELGKDIWVTAYIRGVKITEETLRDIFKENFIWVLQRLLK